MCYFFRQHFDILEAVLGRDLLESFLVFSKRDQHKLMQICEERGLRKPQVFTRKKQDSRYRVQSTHSTGLVFLMDCLNVANDDVFNLLVDTSHIHSVIVGKDEEVANLFGKPLPEAIAFISKGIGYTANNDLYK